MILIIPNIGGFCIWLWKYYVRENKKVKLRDLTDDQSWKAWLVGIIAISVFIWINMIIVACVY